MSIWYPQSTAINSLSECIINNSYNSISNIIVTSDVKTLCTKKYLKLT